jgi:choice-of-anchor C domain-containing protein
MVTAQSIDIVGSLWVAADGKQSVDLTGSPGAGTIEQFLLTVPGQRYRIRFALAGNGGVPAVKELAVAWGDRDIGTQRFDTTGRTATAMGWEDKEYTVTASGSATRLAFRSLTEGSYGPVIDAVSVVAVGSATDSPVTGSVAAPAIARFAMLPAARRRPALNAAARAG